MNRDTRSTSAGGCLLAISIFSGAALGVAAHQISAGILIGCVVGALIAGVGWWLGRRAG